MIHILQCLCGPARHAIMGVMYDDAVTPPAEARATLEQAIEGMIASGAVNRRCEICGEDKKEFWYEDGISKEQDWEKARAQGKVLEAQQALTQMLVKAQRKAGLN